MSIDAIVAQKWSEEALILATQMTSKLRGTVQEVQVTGADIYNFITFDNSTATVGKSRADAVTYNSQNPVKVPCQSQQIYSAFIIDNFDMARSRIDYRNVLTKKILSDLGRQVDGIIISAMSGISGLQTVTLPTANTLNNAGMNAMAMALSAFDVENEDRYMVTHTGGMKHMATDSTIANNFAIQDQVVRKGYVTNIQGFNVIEHNYLPVPTAGQHKRFGYQKNSVGLAVFQDIQLKFDWVPQQLSWQIAGYMYVGAAGLDSSRIVSANVAD
ncbi:MAG TPA: phage capsid protein [Dongiaceae bacterium]|nr:phage capsid protein [Dongiaceae bacterium]